MFHLAASKPASYISDTIETLKWQSYKCEDKQSQPKWLNIHNG